MDRVNSSGKLLNSRIQKSEDDAPDNSNSAATSGNKLPRLSSTRPSPPAQPKLETDEKPTSDVPKVDCEPRIVSWDTAASDAISSHPSTAAPGSSTEQVLSDLVQRAGISSHDFTVKIWPTVKLYLPDSIKRDPLLEKTILIVCKLVKDAKKDNIEFAHDCAEPLSLTDVGPLDKISLLASFLKLSGDLYEKVGDAVAYTVDDPIEREELYGSLCVAHMNDEDLMEWLDKTPPPPAKGEFLEITKEYGLSAVDTKEAWKMIRAVLPIPWPDTIEEFVGPFCASVSHIKSNEIKDFCALIRSPFACMPREQRLFYMIVFLRVPERYRERFANASLFTLRNPVAYKLPIFVVLQMSEQKIATMIEVAEAKIAEISPVIFNLPKEDIGIEVIVEHFPALKLYNTCNRSPNNGHLEHFGNLSIQEKFQALQRTSLHFALKSILQGKESKDKKSAFREILSGLGKRRMNAAYVGNSAAYLANRDCDVPDWEHFGSPVIGPADLTIIPREVLSHTYKEWGDKIISHGSNDIAIKGVAYQLTRIDKNGLGYCYSSFWDKNDPIFSYSCGLYEQLTENELIEPEKIRILLSQLHWVLVGALPFYRGTAAIAESLSDAIWISQGYIPPPGKTLDLLALSTSQEDFEKVYPMGTKWSLEQQ